MDRFYRILALSFIFFTLYSSHSVLAFTENDFNCSSIVKVNSGSLWNASYTNCVNQPVLNVTNQTNITQVTVLNITNTTLNFNQTDLAQNIFDWEKTYKDNLNLNTSVGNLSVRVKDLQAENDQLKIDNLKLNNANSSYEQLKITHNTTLTERNQYKNDADSRIVWAIIAGVAGYFFGNERKNVVPFRKLEIKKTTGKTQGDVPLELIDKALKTDVSDDDLTHVKKDKGE